jgi:hypothetical protein
MTNSDDNMPPQTSKFFDIIPANKRSASPTSRPIIVDNSPSQKDSMINTDQRPDLPEITPDQPITEDSAVSKSSETIDTLLEQNTTEDQINNEPPSPTEEIPAEQSDSGPSLSSEEIPPITTDIELPSPFEDSPSEQIAIEPTLEEGNLPPIQTDIEPTTTLDQPIEEEEELLLPASATPDEVADSNAVVIHSPENSKSFRLRTWLIALLFVIIIVIIGLLLYLFVFKSTTTNTPGTQFFGSSR